MLLAIITFFIVLSSLVLVHEMGHFFTARKMGVKVEEFGMGLPPRIFGFRKEDGNTIYSLNWIPFGGFVKIKGENGENKEETDSFTSKKIWQRALILSSGVIMNLVFAVVLFSIGFLIGLPSATDGLPKYAKIRNEKIIIVETVPEYPAQQAGLKLGDFLLSIDGKEFKEITDIQNYISNRERINVVVKRGDQEINKKIVTHQNEDGKRIIGVALTKSGIITLPWYLALWGGLKATFNLIIQIISVLYYLLKNLFFHGALIQDVTGPIGVAVMTNTMVQMGFVYVLQFAALISINLAIINFLPFPALDGGRVFFLLIEKIKGSPINQKLEAASNNVGFILLILLMLLVTYRDFARFGSQIIRKIIGN